LDKKGSLREDHYKLEFFRRDPNNFFSRLVTTDGTSLCHHDPETKQQSIEQRHGGSPAQKISEFKNPLENFSPRIFGVYVASTSLIVFHRAKLQLAKANKETVTFIMQKKIVHNAIRFVCLCVWVEYISV